MVNYVWFCLSMALWCRRHVFCLTSTHYLLFPSYCGVSSLYQGFLFYNPAFFLFLPFLLIFPLLGKCFPCLQPKKIPPLPSKKEPKFYLYKFQNYFLISCFLYVSILLSSITIKNFMVPPPKENKIFLVTCVSLAIKFPKYRILSHQSFRRKSFWKFLFS
jgi:hypothetical protein